ncbi:inner membrane protein [Shigella dysenteriae]|nr:inner membrane protein [Shigella dysenteriae]
MDWQKCSGIKRSYLVTGIFMFLAPACGLMIRFMVGYGRR